MPCSMLILAAELPRWQVLAYTSLVTGSQRADVFRVLYLKRFGGIYADIDQELRAPLSEVPHPPPAATTAYHLVLL